MGKIFTGIFGGSTSKQKSQSQQQSTSSNQAYPWLQQTYGPQAQQGLNASGALANLLGLNGPSQYDEAFNDYKDSAGYDFLFDQGQKAITGSNAVKGLLNSGSTLKALNKYGTNTASTFFDKYLNYLLGLSNQGLQIGSLISGAGNTSQSTGSSSSKGSSFSSPGIASGIGSVLSGMPGG